MWAYEHPDPQHPNDEIIGLGAQLDGLHIQTGSTDLNGRLVSGNFQSAKVMPDGRIGIKPTRYMNGKHVLDRVAGPAGKDPPPVANRSPRP